MENLKEKIRKMIEADKKEKQEHQERGICDSCEAFCYCGDAGNFGNDFFCKAYKLLEKLVNE